MPLAITLSKTRFRFDSLVKPSITATGITNVGKILVARDAYLPISNSTPYEYSPLNQTDEKVIELRNVARPTWSLGSNVSLDASDPKKSTANSDSGASVSALNSTNCAIEGAATAVNLKCGISLQSGSVAYNESGEHCLIFGDNGIVSVWENGSQLHYTQRAYAVGDIGLIDKQGSVVRYYLMSDGVLHLLRTTRSRLTDADIKGVVILYHINAKLSGAYIYANESTSASIETFGVLSNFQDWQNDFAFTSTAEVLTMQDGNKSYTFANSKKRLRTINATRNVVSKEDREKFLAFFDYHGVEKDFIFVDNARKDASDAGAEFWANFASPFGDKARSSCLSAESAVIVESFRKDIVLL